MQFTYCAYDAMISLLREKGYAFCSYHDYSTFPRCVILRHDIDFSHTAAVNLAEREAQAGVQATYFVLLRTDFYNVASKAGEESLRRILDLGHEIGLHFDEAAYGKRLTEDEIKANILQECGILSSLLDRPVTTVSMHRPSQMALDADLQIPGMVNSYGQTFFHEFKYLSDSRCRWREPVEEIVKSGEYNRLHILTHAFWYHEQEENIATSVGNFVRSANDERYQQMLDNISDLSSILPKEKL